MSTSTTSDTPTVYRAVNSDGAPVEVAISRDIVVVADHPYLDAEQVRERFSVCKIMTEMGR